MLVVPFTTLSGKLSGTKKFYFTLRYERSVQIVRGVTEEIPVLLRCTDVDPMHSPRIGYSLCNQWLVFKKNLAS